MGIEKREQIQRMLQRTRWDNRLERLPLEIDGEQCVTWAWREKRAVGGLRGTQRC